MDILTRNHSDTLSRTPRIPSFPLEIVEMIIAHLEHDTLALKACAATCFSWHSIAIPHLHHTLRLRGWVSKDFKNQRSDQLPSLFTLGLLPFVKQLQFGGAFAARLETVPAVFDSDSMRYFRAMVNLQELRFMDLDFSQFPVGFGEYLGHFAPTLRSVSLDSPNATRRQLLNFFRLFPKLDDIRILSYSARRKAHKALNTKLIPISGGLRGRLSLDTFDDERLLNDMAVTFGGMRFTSVYLRKTRGMDFLLDACADTARTLRIYPGDECPEDSCFGKRVLTHEIAVTPSH